MPEPLESRSLIESAEQAAAAGDYSSAEKLLREAAALQEQTLGAQHPDLDRTEDSPTAEHERHRTHASHPGMAVDQGFAAIQHHR